MNQPLMTGDEDLGSSSRNAQKVAKFAGAGCFVGFIRGFFIGDINMAYKLAAMGFMIGRFFSYII